LLAVCLCLFMPVATAATDPLPSWTEGVRFGLIVHHTDAGREWAYDRDTYVGKLDKALDEAAARGWTVVYMNNDWRVIYPFQLKKQE
jgi:hypothetical protein